jgi:tetratricopeptide (TPR) repeat protein
MRVAVLPFNTAEGVKPAFGRQFAAFAAEQVRVAASADVDSVSYLTNIQDEQGITRVAYVNIGDEMMPYEQLSPLFEQGNVDLIQDGLLRMNDGAFELQVRYHGPDGPEPVKSEILSFTEADTLSGLHQLIKVLATQAEAPLPESHAGESMEFGTNDPQVFLKFLEGFDSLNYMNQAQGNVALEFSPDPAIDTLLEAVEADKDFEGPYHVLVNLCRACAFYRIGNPDKLLQSLNRLTELVPEDAGAFAALGELFSALGDVNRAADAFEKAIKVSENDAPLYTRLGVVQMQMGMPVNAERNFRKAISMENPDRGANDALAGVLMQTQRGHEVPAIWKALMDKDDQDAEAHAKYAIALRTIGRVEDGDRAFEQALELVDENLPVKRYYAPYLAESGDIDRALDFYEDFLDANPNDVPTLIEYINTLEKAEREVDVIDALKQLLASNPEPNTRAQAMAKLIDLEQPKRVESLTLAQEKLQTNQPEEALQILRPLRNWLADHWKMWLLLASAHNRLEQWTEAEEAANHLLRIFPGCEPAFAELAGSLNGQNRHEDAYRLMQFAVQQVPNSMPMVVNLALAAKRAGYVDEAKNYARQLREVVGPNNELEAILAEIDR